MSIVRLNDQGSTAAIAVNFGFNCYEFRARIGERTVDVIDSDPAYPEDGRRPSGNGIPILFPFPNRIRQGRFPWDGREYQIPLDSRPNAIHGFALDTPWRVIDQGERHVVGQWQLRRDAADRAAWWPTDCLIEVRYELRSSRLQSILHAEIRIANPDTRPMPWGFGTHAYFKLPLAADGSVEHCLIEAPAHQQWVLEDFLPTGERIPVPPEKDLRTGAYVRSAQFDDVLTDVRPAGDSLNCVVMDEEAGLEVVQACDKTFREVVVYTPPNRAAVCLEPYTCVTDAINLQQRGVDAGWRVLNPGEEFRTWIDIIARPVVA
jgi:aldose 1-epimerase